MHQPCRTTKMMGLWVEKDEGDATNGEYIWPLVLCHVTNESKAAFQLKRRLSPLFQENPKMARLSCMGRPHPMDWPCRMTKMVSTPHPLVLCLVTNASEAAFQPRCRLSRISRKAASAFPDINIDPMDWPCWMMKTVSTPHPLSYASSLTHPRRRFNPDAASPVFQGKQRQLSPTLT